MSEDIALAFDKAIDEARSWAIARMAVVVQDHRDRCASLGLKTRYAVMAAGPARSGSAARAPGVYWYRKSYLYLRHGGKVIPRFVRLRVGKGHGYARSRFPQASPEELAEIMKTEAILAPLRGIIDALGKMRRPVATLAGLLADYEAALGHAPPGSLAVPSRQPQGVASGPGNNS